MPPTTMPPPSTKMVSEGCCCHQARPAHEADDASAKLSAASGSSHRSSSPPHELGTDDATTGPSGTDHVNPPNPTSWNCCHGPRRPGIASRRKGQLDGDHIHHDPSPACSPRRPNADATHDGTAARRALPSVVAESADPRIRDPPVDVSTPARGNRSDGGSRTSSGRRRPFFCRR